LLPAILSPFLGCVGEERSEVSYFEISFHASKYFYHLPQY